MVKIEAECRVIHNVLNEYDNRYQRTCFGVSGVLIGKGDARRLHVT